MRRELRGTPSTKKAVPTPSLRGWKPAGGTQVLTWDSLGGSDWIWNQGYVCIRVHARMHVYMRVSHAAGLATLQCGTAPRTACSP